MDKYEIATQIGIMEESKTWVGRASDLELLERVAVVLKDIAWDMKGDASRVMKLALGIEAEVLRRKGRANGKDCNDRSAAD